MERGFTPYHFSYVYVLKSMSFPQELYIGSTNDLRKRLAQHNTGKVVSTKRFTPWRLAYYEAFSDEHTVRVRESRLKNNSNAMLELKKRISVSNARKSDKGFTFFEVLIVMGIFVLVGGFALFVSMETYRGSNFRSDRDLLVATLQRARAESMNNICLGSPCSGNDGKPHGVSFQGGKYVIFQGSSYVTRDAAVDAAFDASPAFTHPSFEIVFSQLTGNATPGVINLSGQGKTSDVHVEANGRIWWTN